MKNPKVSFYLRILLFLSLVPAFYFVFQWSDAEKITEAVHSNAGINAVRIGRPAPDFTVPAVRVWSKQDFRFSTLKGYPVVLHFWATWCGPCLQELPELLKAADARRAEGVTFIAVAEDQSWRDLEVFFTQHPELKSMPEKMVLLLDPESQVAESYGSTQFPESFLINSGMVIDNKFIGAQGWMDPRMEEFFRSLRSNPKP